MALEFADHVTEITATDISAQMIEIAKRKTAEQKVENIDFVQAMLFDERLKNESFHVVMAFNVLHLLGDTQKVMQRVYELLKPGGLFISGTVCLREKGQLWGIITSILNKTGLILHIDCLTMAEMESFAADERQ